MVRREITIDNSITCTWLLPDENTALTDVLLEDILDGVLGLVQPVLWYYESTNVLRSAVRRGRLSEQNAKKALHEFQKIPVELITPSTEGLTDILEASLKHNLSVYDASYFRLAEERGLDLVSADTDLLNLKPHFPWIKSIEDWQRS